MMNHELKIWPEYFREVATGAKTFEVRVNDRNFLRGHTVTLNEYCPHDKKPTGNFLNFKIGYVMYLGDNLAVFSLLKP